MRVDQNLLLSTAFLCTGDQHEPVPHATAFLLIHDGALYLVTAKHVAAALGDDPFYARFNLVEGGSSLLPIDIGMSTEPLFRWFCHPNPAVDIAVLPFPVDIAAQGVQAFAIRSEMSARPQVPVSDAGCGDMCHVIGLFTRRSGRTRNFAVVHTGHIAAMCDSKELIDVDGGGQVEGYLVEISNLPGLSGAPVFVRGGVELDVPLGEDESLTITTHKPDLRLLGVWSGSWDRAVGQGSERVPIGMGIVAPAHRLIELLDSERIIENRNGWLRKLSGSGVSSG